MAPHQPKKWDVFLIDLPVQTVTQTGEHGKPFSVNGTEMHGPHSCIIVFADADNQYCIVVPLTSALDSRGGEKWAKWKNTWHRFTHDEAVVAAQCEQVRYVCRGRLVKSHGGLGEYDRQKIEEKLRMLLAL